MASIKHVILPDTGTDLLRDELALAFAAEGLQVTRVHPLQLNNPEHENSLAHLAQNGPALLFSVNFQGLNPLRSTLETITTQGGKVAVWCVDNPWNLLSGVRDPRWSTLPLFVTDHTFIPDLKRHGAQKVIHLPLAASFAHFAPNAQRDLAFPAPKHPSYFVFVGRSAFPSKGTFFAGLTLPANMLDEAIKLLQKTYSEPDKVNLKSLQLPDFNWWEEKIYPEKVLYWPGKKSRLPALGAEECSLARRTAILTALAPLGLDVYGDCGWQEKLPVEANLFGPVDYYTRLPNIYRSAPFNINITSLQLPGGLTQRHFDVWAAGGFLLSDATPGLKIFPKDLVEPIIFSSPKKAVLQAKQLEPSIIHSSYISDWQSLLQREHTYKHRVIKILEYL